MVGAWLGLLDGLAEGESVGLDELAAWLGLADGCPVGLGVNKPTGGMPFGAEVGDSVKQFGVTHTKSPLAAGRPVDTVSPPLVLK